MRVYDSGTYRDMTEAEVSEIALAVSPEAEIESLKQKLADTDYIAIKYAEGWISDTDYADTKKMRQSWRDEINRLEEMDR